jgi:hypothetical protein
MQAIPRGSIISLEVAALGYNSLKAVVLLSGSSSYSTTDMYSLVYLRSIYHINLSTHGDRIGIKRRGDYETNRG